MTTLFNAEHSDSDEELKINNDYANNYNNWRQKEELNKLKTKYGDVNDRIGLSDEESEDDTSSDEEEDENTLKEQFDKDFYKALACLKSKDPKIYNEDVKFFEDTSKVQKSKKDQKSNKKETIFLRDYERKIIVERDGKFSDSEDEDALKAQEDAANKVTYVEEQRQLKDSFKQVLLEEEEEEEEEEAADLLKPKSKSEKDIQKEEADYKEWLKGQKLEINDTEQKELKPLRDFWTNPNLDANEKFLRDYVLNNKFLEKDQSNTGLDYEQVAHDSDDNLSEDEKNIEEQEEFEHKYNFRYEEPDKDFIKRYPRTMENSMRKKDTRRSEKRAEVKQRKEEDKLRKKEELMQLKALKRKEIEEKIEKLREITGNDDIKLNDIDLDADFDPNEHDRKMTEIFNDDYYAVADDAMKPEFPDIDKELEIEGTWDNYDPNADNAVSGDYESYGGPHCEDENFNMDADYDESKIAEMQDMDDTKKRKRKRRSKFAELIAKEKPKFDPKQYQNYEEYFDKYYSLDYEDMIGDLPCRFKYRKVVPNDYGLDVEEILMADDKELNKWCSLKKALQYKPEHVELNDVRTYKQKARDEAVKRKILRSLYSVPEDEQDVNETGNAAGKSTADTETAETKKKRRRKKKKQDVISVNNNSTIEIADGLATNNGERNKNEVEVKNTEVVVEQKSTVSSKAKKRKQKSKSEQPEEKKCKVDDAVEPSLKKKLIKKSDELAKSDSTNSKNTEPVNIQMESKSITASKKSKKKQKLKKKFEGNQQKNSKRKENSSKNDDITSLNPERLKMYGINPKKLKNKLKYGKKEQ